MADHRPAAAAADDSPCAFHAVVLILVFLHLRTLVSPPSSVKKSSTVPLGRAFRTSGTSMPFDRPYMVSVSPAASSPSS